METMTNILPADTDRIVCETELIVFRGSTIHGTGGYARRPITARTPVIEYVGEKITKAEALVRLLDSQTFVRQERSQGFPRPLRYR